MGQAEKHSRPHSELGVLPSIFIDEADAEKALMQERWRRGQQTDAAERQRLLHILHAALAEVRGENTLQILRETTALPRIIRPERWQLESVSQLEALIYSICDASSVPPDSPLWRGELLPCSMRVATAEETLDYAPDSTGVTRTAVQTQKSRRTPSLGSGETLVAADTEAQAMLDFVAPYLADESDASHATIDFHRESRLRENYAERTEHALESALTMYEIAKDFADTLLRAQQTVNQQERNAMSDIADELLMEFNLQRYSLYALMQTSHWDKREDHAEQDKDFVRQLSRDLLIHALADKSYALPTTNEMHAREYQGNSHATVESYFDSAYEHMDRVLAIRPHRDRVMVVPRFDADCLNSPEGKVH